jgi:putative copper export protein
MEVLLKFLHLTGPMLWFGAAVASMVMARSSRNATQEGRIAVYEGLARVYSIVIAPAAALAIISGLVWVGVTVTAGRGAVLGRPGATFMMVAGLVAAVLVIAVSLPAAHRRAALVKGQMDAKHQLALASVEKRLTISSMAAGTLLWMSVLGVLLP